MLLARLDSWIVTVAECMILDEGKGGHRQRKFNSMFHKLLPMATEQLLSTICEHVWKEHPMELEVAYDDSLSAADCFGNEDRIATQVYESRRDDCFYICVQKEWFRDHISKELGLVCDCFIGEGSKDGEMFQLYGIEGNADTRARSGESDEMPLQFTPPDREILSLMGDDIRQ